MPTYTTTVNLLAASASDLEKLNEAMKVRSFHPKNYQEQKQQSTKGTAVYMSTTKANLVEASTDVSTAASSIGKKFSFTIMKDK